MHVSIRIQFVRDCTLVRPVFHTAQTHFNTGLTVAVLKFFKSSGGTPTRFGLQKINPPSSIRVDCAYMVVLAKLVIQVHAQQCLKVNLLYMLIVDLFLFIYFYLKSQHDIIQFKNEYRMIKKSHQASNARG